MSQCSMTNGRENRNHGNQKEGSEEGREEEEALTAFQPKEGDAQASPSLLCASLPAAQLGNGSNAWSAVTSGAAAGGVEITVSCSGQML